MTFDVVDVAKDAIDRLATGVGAVVVLGLAAFGVVQTAGWQDLARAAAERLRAQLTTPEARAELTDAQVAEIQQGIDAFIAELPLAFGLRPGLAAVVVLVGVVLSLVVTVLAIDAFGRERDDPAELGVDGLAAKTLNLFFGFAVFGILFFVGLLLFVIPGLLVLVFLWFFAAAVVIDDESFFEAFATSGSVVRENLFGTVGVIVVVVLAGVVVGIVGGLVTAVLPAVGAVVADNVLSAVTQAFALAVTARAYVEATTAPDGAETQPAAGGPESDDRSGESA